MISIDPTRVANGCLEVAFGQHRGGLMDMTSAQVLSESAIAELEWVPLETDPGDLVLFGSFLPHRSGPNTSAVSRRAAYLTYNARSEGDFREQYYASKRAVFPPEIEREEGKDYSNTGLYNIGNPIRK
jgi:ectoine hydroxylase-related dioxygenase (phytanoyl-CoA dioxygenase family)